MEELSLDELKRVELQLLQWFHELCQQEGLRYTLAEGTLLGAVRHRGFIPWDDDLDVAMPRPDYEKLIRCCQSHDVPFRLLCSQTEKNYGYCFAKAVAKDTVIVERHIDAQKVNLGVYIDIFPIDGMGNSIQEAHKHMRATKLARALLVAANWKHFFRSQRAWYYEPIRFLFFVFSRFVSFEKMIARIEKYHTAIDYEQSEYVGIMCMDFGLAEIFPKRVYASLKKYVFENSEAWGVEDYHGYLQQLYGDYMQLPPEAKRVTHHSFTAYRRN